MAKSHNGFKGKLGVYDNRTLIGHENHAVGAGIVRQRVLKREQILGQAVGNNHFHARLAEGAACLLVAEHIAQGGDLPRQVGEVLLGMVDHGDALMQALEALHGLAGGLVHGVAESHRDRIEPLRHHAGELRLAAAQTLPQSLEAAGGLRLDTGQFGDSTLHRLAPPRLAGGLACSVPGRPDGNHCNGEQQPQRRDRKCRHSHFGVDGEHIEGQERSVHRSVTCRFGVARRKADGGNGIALPDDRWQIVCFSVH